MKNSSVWFDFFEKYAENGCPRLAVRKTPISDSAFLMEAACEGAEGLSQTFAAGRVDENLVSSRIRSGEHSAPIAELEGSLRSLRGQYPHLPLLVWMAPEMWRPRSHAWMLGEYMAERDLPLWADISGLHPARMIDWAGNLYECGLASPRTVIQASDAFEMDDFTRLRNTGVWLYLASGLDGVSTGVIRQA